MRTAPFGSQPTWLTNLRRWAIGVVFLVLGCAAPSTPHVAMTLGPQLGGLDCNPPSPRVRGNLGLDLLGTSEGGSVFARMSDPLRPQTEEKIIWRVTGTGALRAFAEHTDGARVLPARIGPHSGSDWQRPGDEWGSAFVLPKSGCWRFHLERDGVKGDVWVLVPEP